jgi:hypothetical protein
VSTEGSRTNCTLDKPTFMFYGSIVIFLLRFLRDTLAFHVLRTHRFIDIHR